MTTDHIFACIILSIVVGRTYGGCQLTAGPDQTLKGAVLQINNVPENLSIGSVVASLNVTGSDVRLRLDTTSAANQLFALQNLSLILLKSLMNRTDIVFDISCYNGNVYSQTYYVYIDIVTIDMYPPKFTNSTYEISVSEATPVNSLLITFQAVDPDPDNMYVSFSLANDTNNSLVDFFKFLGTTDGKLYLRQPLDYEEYKRMFVTVLAVDNHKTGTIQLTSSVTLTIDIVNIDDEDPVFQAPPYRTVIDSNTTVGSMLTVYPRISAIDRDTSFNDSIQYRLAASQFSGYADYFTMNPVSGDLYLSRLPPSAGKYPLLIEAFEPQRPKHSATSVVVAEVFAPAIGPQFTQEVFIGHLLQNSPLGSTVLTTTLKNCSTEQLRFSLTNPLDQKTFAVNETTGAVILISTSDLDLQTSFTFQVSVTDGILVATCDVLIQVIPVNNHNPVFTATAYSFTSRGVINGVVGQVQANDEDRNAIVSYSLLYNASIFYLNPSSGQIFLVAAAEQGLYQLAVIASDNGDPPRQVVVLVNIDLTGGLVEPVLVPSHTCLSSSVLLIIVIILAVCLGLLIIALIVMAICYRKGTGKHQPVDAVRPRSFEHDHHPYTSYLSATKHLDLYNSVLDNGDTQTQENPFESTTDDPIPVQLQRKPFVYSQATGLTDSDSLSFVKTPTPQPSVPSTGHQTAGAGRRPVDIRSGAEPRYTTPYSGAELRLNDQCAQEFRPTASANHSIGGAEPVEVLAPPLQFSNLEIPVEDVMRGEPHHPDLHSFKTGSTTRLVARDSYPNEHNGPYVDSPNNSFYSSTTSQRSGFGHSTIDVNKPGITVIY